MKTLWLCLSICVLAFALTFAETRTEKLEDKIRNEFLHLTQKQSVPTIKAFELKKIIDDSNLILIDIRESKEQQVSMLPHSLSTVEFAQKFKHGIPSRSKIVTYCTIGYRSGIYAGELRKQQIIAYNLEGGILAWSHIHGEIFAKDSSGQWIKTNRIHVYAKEWNFVHPDYQAVW